LLQRYLHLLDSPVWPHPPVSGLSSLST
jgi:hypothetical protein